jgi:serine/threonine protein kinase
MNKRAIFEAAMEIDDADRRAAYLNEACGGDTGLRQQIEELLAAQEKLGSFLVQPVAGPMATQAYLENTERPGDTIGRYKLKEKIGEGGFGLVFVAEQSEPVKRRVALKIIKPGMDSKQIIARFEAERQALAMMDHPNIARVLDAGSTDSGRPYFVMELVRGIPITQYCDQNQLPPRDRLELFVTVCHAIQHAHQKGIIHRDVKPSNVLVTSHDGKPVAKVIDFGVAKALHQNLADHSIYTNFAKMIGTPLYMSPEQAEMSGLDIDTRSDIYSLGVLLYELLTGSTPIERQRFAQAAYDEIRRLIRDEEAQKPSDRLSSSHTLPSLAANRKTEPTKLSRLMRGDLDWITLKALEKDRTRRYETANGLAMDLQRHLEGEPVLAAPPTATYRLRKFARKHRAVLATSLTIMALLLLGIGVSTWQAVRATQAERIALSAVEAERQAKQDAEAQKVKAVNAQKVAKAAADEANAVLKFFEEKVFAAGRPKGEKGGLGHDVSLKEAMLASLPALDSSFTRQPLVEARLRTAVGLTFDFLGERTKAIEQHERACAINERNRGPDHMATLGSKTLLAGSYRELKRYTEALKLREEVFNGYKRLLSPDHVNSLIAMSNLAISYNDVGQIDVALKLREDAVAICTRVLPPDHYVTLMVKSGLAGSYVAVKRHAEALKVYEETIAVQKRVLSPDHSHIRANLHSVARTYASMNNHVEALKWYENMLEACKRVLPVDHPEKLMCMNAMVLSYSALGQHEEADKIRVELQASYRRMQPPDYPAMVKLMLNMALRYSHSNRYAEALKLVDEFMPYADKPGVNPSHYSLAISIRITCCKNTGDLAGCRSAAELMEKRKPSDADSYFVAACSRAVIAELQAKVQPQEFSISSSPTGTVRPATKDADMLARKEADKAMVWLKQALAAGLKKPERIKDHTDLNFLRSREDFKLLVAGLEEQ